MVTRGYAERKRLFDRVQAIVVENLPLVPLVSPNLLAGAKKGLANFQPAVIEPYTLWNIEQLYWRAGRSPPVSQPISGVEQYAAWWRSAWPAMSAPGARCWIATRT